MFGKRKGFEVAPEIIKEINSVEKVARILSIDERVKGLVTRYEELQLGVTNDDAVLLDEVAMELRSIFKVRRINLGIDEANNADIRAFVESFNAALEQNTGRRG